MNDSISTEGTPGGPTADEKAPHGTSAPAAPHGTPPEPHGEDEKTSLEAIKREARKWETQSKRNKEALDALREQVKTLVNPETVESKDKDLAATKADLAAARQEAMRYRVALAAGLPVDLAARLVGDTEEALVADAQTLKGLVTAKPVKGTPDAAAGTNGQPDKKMAAGDALRMALGYPTR